MRINASVSDEKIAEELKRLLTEQEELESDGEYVEANCMDEDIEEVQCEIVKRWMYEQGHRI